MRLPWFCDACRRYRYSGLCYGPPGVGKTLSARHYADWDRVASADPYAGRAAFRSDEVPGNGCVLYTAAVVNSPRQIEDEIARLRRKLRDLILQAVRGEAEPVIAAARRALEQERDIGPSSVTTGSRASRSASGGPKPRPPRPSTTSPRGAEGL